jgi:hypothetical protein
MLNECFLFLCFSGRRRIQVIRAPIYLSYISLLSWTDFRCAVCFFFHFRPNAMEVGQWHWRVEILISLWHSEL